jgi:hypothetical protein
MLLSHWRYTREELKKIFLMKGMSYSYAYDVTGVANVATNAPLLQNHLSNDLSIIMAIISVVYNSFDQTLELTWTSEPSYDDQYQADVDIHIIIFGDAPSLYYTTPRSVYSGAKSAPNSLSDYNEGWTIGSVVHYGGYIYVCTSNAIGNAVWDTTNAHKYGFAVTRSLMSVASDTTINSWTIPTGAYFDETSGDLNTASGVFTVPVNGVYEVNALINYQITSTITESLGDGIDPAFELRRNVTSPETLIRSNMPVFDVNVPSVLDLRTILSNGQCIIMDNVQLNTGDQIYLRYVSDGMTLSVNIGGPNSIGLFWSINRIK